MGVVKLSTAGILDYSKTSNFLSGNAPVSFSAFDLLETQVLTSSAASVTFSSIPQDYKHLQIRMAVRSTGTGNPRVLTQFNSDSGTNYAYHNLFGTGSTVYSENNSSNDGWNYYFVPNSSQTAGIFGAAVYDILDYSSVSKNTTTRVFGGAANAGVNYDIGLHSFLWNNTAAITSILLSGDGQSFATGTRFSLYGIKG